MAQLDVPSFSQAAIEAFRYSQGFKTWNRDFESLKRKIQRRVSPHDLQPILKAGAEEDRVLTLLAFIVCDSKGLLSQFMRKRKALASLAVQLETVTKHAARIVKDPLCDGRFWLALEGGLSWDLVPQSGVIETPTLERMRALAQLIKDRGDLLGKLSRDLKRIVRNRGMRDLIAYVGMCTEEPFNSNIAYLLGAAHKAAGLEKHFTADQIKKFRQRNLAGLRIPVRDNAQDAAVTTALGSTTAVDREPKRTTFGQRIAGIV
jgi:hypothetical protein